MNKSWNNMIEESLANCVGYLNFVKKKKTLQGIGEFIPLEFHNRNYLG